MPVNAIAQDSKLRLKLDDGVNENGNQVLKSKTLSGVKATAVDEDIYNVAVSLSSLQTKPLVSVKRIDEVDLEEV